MFNKRSFLMGIGVGIIIGALLLQLFHLGESSQSKLEEIGRDLAQEIGTREETGASPSPSSTSGSEAGPGERSSEASEATSSAQPEPPFGETAQSQPEEPVDKPEVPSEDHRGVVIRIEPGAVLAESAELLARAGVISEQEALIRQMKAGQQVVRAGYFLFPHGQSTTAEAIAIITGKPLTETEVAQYGDLLWHDVGEQL